MTKEQAYDLLTSVQDKADVNNDMFYGVYVIKEQNRAVYAGSNMDMGDALAVIHDLVDRFELNIDTVADTLRRLKNKSLNVNEDFKYDE